MVRCPEEIRLLCCCHQTFHTDRQEMQTKVHWGWWDHDRNQYLNELNKSPAMSFAKCMPFPFHMCVSSEVK